MRTLFPQSRLARIVTTVLLALSATAAQVAPSLAQAERCGPCGRSAECSLTPADAAATVDQGCCCASGHGDGASERRKHSNGEDAPRGCACPDCSLACGGRAAAAFDAVAACPTPLLPTFGLTLPPATPQPRGVHPSVFHPPRA